MKAFALLTVLAGYVAASAPIHSAAAPIPRRYLVVLKDDAGVNVAQHTTWLNSILPSGIAPGVEEWSANQVHRVFDSEIMKGYSGTFHPDVVAAISEHEDVAFIEEEQTFRTQEVQRRSTWGLARISHRDSLSFRTFNKYVYTPPQKRVVAYVIDTGVRISHKGFEGRARWGASFTDDAPADANRDCAGHGTHVAGTIGSHIYGVDKTVEIVAVKVLNCEGTGSTADVVAGINWAVEDHLKHKGQRSVANMSLGGGSSRALDMMVNAAVEKGVHMAVAAGNENGPACDSSPASAQKAVTVGASTILDTRAYFSNYGKCVDIFAPGKDILSTWNTDDISTNTISGTSMATPHVCGLMAYFLSFEDTELSYKVSSPKDMKKLLKKLSTKDALEMDVQDTPNLLIYNCGEGDSAHC